GSVGRLGPRTVHRRQHRPRLGLDDARPQVSVETLLRGVQITCRFPRPSGGDEGDMGPAQSLTRSVPTRHMEFDSWLDDVPRHFAADGNIVMSHILAVLSSVFPDGEDYFVRSVEAVRDRIVEPRLRAD